jgi:hypothetical protein
MVKNIYNLVLKDFSLTTTLLTRSLRKPYQAPKA